MDEDDVDFSVRVGVHRGGLVAGDFTVDGAVGHGVDGKHVDGVEAKN